VTEPFATNPVVVAPVGVLSVTVQVPWADAEVANGSTAAAIAAELKMTAPVTVRRRVGR
jgi:hypothetical protein